MPAQIGLYSIDYADRCYLYADVIRVNLELLTFMHPIERCFEFEMTGNAQQLYKALLDGILECAKCLNALSDPNVKTELSKEEYAERRNRIR